MPAAGSGWSARTCRQPNKRRGPRRCASGDWSARGAERTGCWWYSLAVDQQAVPPGAQAGGRPRGASGRRAASPSHRPCDVVVGDGGLAVDEVVVIFRVKDGDLDVLAREAFDVRPG